MPGDITLEGGRRFYDLSGNAGVSGHCFTGSGNMKSTFYLEVRYDTFL